MTEQALAGAIVALDERAHPTPSMSPADAAQASPAASPSDAAVSVLSNLSPGATLAPATGWTITVNGDSIASVTVSADGATLATETHEPFTFSPGAGGIPSAPLSDGGHTLRVAVTLAGGVTDVAVCDVSVTSATGAALTALSSSPVALPVSEVAGEEGSVSAGKPTAQAAAATVPSPAAPVLYRAESPASAVTVRELDAAMVDYLGLEPAAHLIQLALAKAGLEPPPNTGSEVVARLLGLPASHPANQDDLDLLPDEDATRAEAAYSLAQLLALSESATASVESLAQGFGLPALSPWQRRILTTAVRYVGYPYVWGGTSPTAEAPFGVMAPGGFDCSGFVWRVYKLTPYPNEGNLASVLRGRTTYQMSGEVPRWERIPAPKLEPGDVMFFGDGPASKPSEVDHAALYVGNGWLIQSAGEGVTLTPFSGWYRQTFAWARRPLREAGLV